MFDASRGISRFSNFSVVSGFPTVMKPNAINHSYHSFSAPNSVEPEKPEPDPSSGPGGTGPCQHGPNTDLGGAAWVLGRVPGS